MLQYIFSICQDIEQNNGPNDFIFTLGYAGWDKKQLDNEIKNGDWLIHDTSKIIFDKNPKTLWTKLIKSVGFDKFKITGIGGIS